MPTKISFSTAPTGNISYIYNALGQKVKKTVTQTPANTVTTTDYLGGFQYKNAGLQFFPTAEGYYDFVKKGYVYNYTDHLGNVRLSYQDINKDGAVANSEILEESNYYPFGLKHSGYNSGNLQANYKYKYNGKELQDELGLNMYDYGMMLYDPAIGRRNNVDPKAEQMRRWSTYAYCFNNPLRFTDPDEMSPYDVHINISKEVVGTTQIRVIGSENVNGAPRTMEVATYAMTITDDVTGTTSTYYVTRDAPVMNTNNPSAGNSSYNVNNAAFEPKQETGTYQGVVDSDYPRGTDLPAIALRNEKGGTGLAAEPMPGAERKNPTEANDVSVHVGGVYENPNSSTGLSRT